MIDARQIIVQQITDNTAEVAVGDSVEVLAGKAKAGAVRRSYKNPKLTNWITKLATSPATAKMIFVGDSTSDLSGNASGLPGFITARTSSGDYLYNFSTSNMPNFGANGNTIANFYLNSPSGKGINDVIAAAPDLIIFSYGINDIRQNLLTKDQLKTYLINIVNIFKTALPATDIVLRMPNSFKSVSPNSYIVQGGYADIATAAQAQTDILYYAYKELEGYWDNVIVWDTQNTIWGRTCQATALWMTDEIHPDYGYMIPGLVSIIGYKPPFSEKMARAALYTSLGAAATNYATPWVTYPRVLEYTKNFIKLVEGTLYTQIAGSLLDILVGPFGGYGDAYEGSARLLQGDIVNIGDSLFLVLPLGVSFSVTSKTVVRIAGFTNLTSNSFAQGTPVAVYRSIYNHTYAIEQYMNDTVNYPYRRRVSITGATNFIDIGTLRDRPDGLTKYDLKLSPEELQLTASDVICAVGQTPLVLTGATFSPQGNLRTTVTGSFSAYTGIAYIFGNHAYENSMDRTNTAAGTTTNQTINKQSGIINIAAAGTSATVTNSMVKSTSIVQAVVRTNDSTAVIKNVVPANGSFVINLNAATTAETSIGFIVFN